MSTRAGAALTGALVLLAGLGVAGCGGGVDRLSFADPPATTAATPAPPVTLPADLDRIGETPVGGATTTTVPALGPGTASLVGTVTGPTGQPVPGATVEVDRVVGYTYVSTTTTTAADGSWSVRNILGGDYRVRAWRAPDLDMPTPYLLFLADGSSATVSLQETSYQADSVQVAINPPEPVLGQPVELVVQVTDPVVSADGVLSQPPTPGAVVTLVDGADWQVQNGNPLTTDRDGQASFVVDCTAAGSDPLSAEVGTSAPVALQMPPCLPPPPPTTTTTTTAPTTTTTVGSYPTTTCPPSGGSTTTTLAFGSAC